MGHLWTRKYVFAQFLELARPINILAFNNNYNFGYANFDFCNWISSWQLKSLRNCFSLFIRGRERVFKKKMSSKICWHCLFKVWTFFNQLISICEPLTPGKGYVPLSYYTSFLLGWVLDVECICCRHIRYQVQYM